MKPAAIYIVGFMGSGKSTVGRLLASRLNWPFADLDDDIEAAAGATIADLFAGRGEADFREIEYHALSVRAAAATPKAPFVLALGGGAFAQERNRELLKGKGVTVWLDIMLSHAMRRVQGFDHRPLAQNPAEFARLFHSRRAAYEQADLHVNISSDDPASAVFQILTLLVLSE